MAIIRKMIYENEPLTAQQLKQIEEAEKKPFVFDEDCPELTKQQLREIAAIAAQQRAERRKQLLDAQEKNNDHTNPVNYLFNIQNKK